MAFKKEVLDIRDAIIATTQKLIQINTVRSAARHNAPFGQGNRAALDYILNLGEKWGFKTKDLDGYAGYLEFGEGEEVVVIMPHIDVVAEGIGWNYPPFAGEIHEGRIYGRGAADNKGPAVASLYAFKLVRDSGLPIKKRVRLVFGCNEESGFACVKYYIKAEGLPTAGFTPDASFPVVTAEKGIINAAFTAAFPAGTVPFTFVGGTASNVVPAYATAVFSGKTYEATGIAAHASNPAAGENAIFKLANQLQGVINHPVLEFLKAVADPETIGIAMQDEISGSLTYNLGLIQAKDNKASISVNIRYPVTAKSAGVIDKLKGLGEPYGFTLEAYTDSLPHYVQEDAPLVKTLLDVFTEVTGLAGKPLAIGGGTYARYLGNFVAFGGHFPEEPRNAHKKNEFISIDSLLKNAEIYATAIYELAKVY